MPAALQERIRIPLRRLVARLMKQVSDQIKMQMNEGFPFFTCQDPFFFFLSLTDRVIVLADDHRG